MNLSSLDHYERRAIHDIRAWVAGDRGLLRQAADGLGSTAGQASRPLEWAFNRAMRDQRVAATVEQALRSASEGMGRYMAATTPWEGAATAYGLDDPIDIATLHLRDIDAQLKRIRNANTAVLVGMGVAEGAATVVSVPTALMAFAASIPAMQAASLRAVSDLSRHAGFDPGDFAERRFTAEVTLASLELGGSGHDAAVARLLGLDQHLAARRTFDQLQQMAVLGTLREQSTRFGLALTRRRLAVVLPLIGAAIGAGFNAVYADRLLGGATMVYRARHLARAHDLDLAELVGLSPTTVAP